MCKSFCDVVIGVSDYYCGALVSFVDYKVLKDLVVLSVLLTFWEDSS